MPILCVSQCVCVHTLYRGCSLWGTMQNAILDFNLFQSQLSPPPPLHSIYTHTHTPTHTHTHARAHTHHHHHHHHHHSVSKPLTCGRSYPVYYLAWEWYSSSPPLSTPTHLFGPYSGSTQRKPCFSCLDPPRPITIRFLKPLHTICLPSYPRSASSLYVSSRWFTKRGSSRSPHTVSVWPPLHCIRVHTVAVSSIKDFLPDWVQSPWAYQLRSPALGTPTQKASARATLLHLKLLYQGSSQPNWLWTLAT